MHAWRGDYDQLESDHSFIQWLFPICEGSGVNSSAVALSREEARLIRKSRECGENIFKVLGTAHRLFEKKKKSLGLN